MFSRNPTYVLIAFFLSFSIVDIIGAESCDIETELPDGKEIETIHNNVLCLHDLLIALATSQAEPGPTEQADLSGYITLPSSPTLINPCSHSSDPAANIICLESILRRFSELCSTEDCAEGFWKWRNYMPRAWVEYIDLDRYNYSIKVDTWVSDVTKDPRFFRSEDSVSHLDIQQFFQSIPPDAVLTPAGPRN